MAADDLLRLGRALGHPIRVAILAWPSEGGEKTLRPVRLAEALGESLGVVSYHVRVLADLELLILHQTRPARGAIAHEYVLAPGVAAALARLSGKRRRRRATGGRGAASGAGRRRAPGR
jgi:DNA-binding transcriptional ArsR family regulator